ncbi:MULTISPECIES: hypothetical protein [unclassified Massilia]|uniref:hypothetical protein n=1 Tax=unclassified Massilia TaxID=2609279 RepID=UPI00177B2FAB|nr:MULTISPECIES: hypothetical protein [unclassified Massilia]MBD8530886.1 hypothetical protein [Massilia sp. CFBP 13647]MBD8674701.1 hypothetical protein [Massilia sp. CFBP 13721]
MRRHLLGIAAVSIVTLAGSAHAASSTAGLKDALKDEYIGLLPADSFHLRTGKCQDCAVPKQNLWYFENEVIAVPASTATAAGFSKGVDRNSDVAQWAATPDAARLAHPSVTWIGAPSILERATLLPGAQTVRTAAGDELGFKLVPQLSTNRSYFNSASADYFKGRALRMRGTASELNGRATFTARTIWPADFGLDTASLKSEPLKNAAELTDFVRAPVKDQQGVETRLLWERHPGQARAWTDKPVLGVVLNGAQGDDDESLGGHFAIATGRLGAQGDWSGWAVNNFYNLDSVSEKGIVAATVPMDNYLMDLNSGQQYYRPSYMLVAVLNHARTAAAYQGGVQRVFNHFYRHDFRYRHAAANCAGISVDVFKALGWSIPERGPTAPLKSVAAYAYVSATDASLTSGRKIYDYLNEEQTRLLPAVAFDAIGQDLLDIVGGKPQRDLSVYEQQLRDDVEAIVLVRIPQIPSSRVMGSAPVFSFDEFRERVPADQADWKIVPVGERPFPAAFQGDGFKAEGDPSVIPLPVAGIGTGTLLAVAIVLRRRKQRRKLHTKQVPVAESVE